MEAVTTQPSSMITMDLGGKIRIPWAGAILRRRERALAVSA
jgi:hypothetical protein